MSPSRPARAASPMDGGAAHVSPSRRPPAAATLLSLEPGARTRDPAVARRTPYPRAVRRAHTAGLRRPPAPHCTPAPRALRSPRTGVRARDRHQHPPRPPVQNPREEAPLRCLAFGCRATASTTPSGGAAQKAREASPGEPRVRGARRTHRPPARPTPAACLPAHTRTARSNRTHPGHAPPSPLPPLLSFGQRCAHSRTGTGSVQVGRDVCPPAGFASAQPEGPGKCEGARGQAQARQGRSD